MIIGIVKVLPEPHKNDVAVIIDGWKTLMYQQLSP